jgi:hypothetical protein
VIRNVFIIVCYIVLSTSSCGIYSFTGASISSDVKTISIQNFLNKATLSPPLLSNNLTEGLRDKFISETNLTPQKADGDISFSGYVSSYSISPIAIQANETAAQNRLSISVKVSYINTLAEENNYDKTFSRYVDYDSSQDFNSIEESLNEQIIVQLIEDIFNEAFANW